MLQVSELHFAYASDPARAILSGINLHLAHGEKLALVGANGSGKSTLLLQVAGCLAPSLSPNIAQSGTKQTSGRIFLNGEDCTAHPRRAGQHLGLLFQRQECQLLLPTVREELLLSLADSPLSPEERHEQVAQFAHEFGIAQLLERPPHRLSGGEQQRVALATLLIAKPTLLVLDEPTAALDPRARRRLIDFVRELDLAILVASHDLDFALSVCSRTLIIDQGRLVADGPTRELLTNGPLLRTHGLDLPISMQ